MENNIDNIYWWKASKEDVHKKCWEYAKNLIDLQSSTYERFKSNHQLYSLLEASGIYGGKTPYISDDGDFKVAFKNLIASTIDTIVSHFGCEENAVDIETDDANWEQFEKAKLMSAFINGQFHNNDYFTKKRSSTKGAGIYGKAFIHTYDVDGEIKNSYVPPYEIIYDEEEAKSGNPRILARIRDVSKQWLIAQFPKHEFDIKSSKPFNGDNFYLSGNENRQSNADRTTILEWWRLPSENYDDEKKKGEVGRYVLSLEGCTLDDVPYEDQFFPFIPVTLYGESDCGIWPKAVVNELQPIQEWLNEVVYRAWRQNRGSSVKIAIEKGSEVDLKYLDNEDMAIIYYAAGSKPPTPIVLGAIDPNLFNLLNVIDKFAQDRTGVNELMARGEKPSGLDSGEAQVRYQEITSKRMMEIQKNLEKVDVEVAMRHLELARRIAKRGDGSIKILAKTDEGWRGIDWSEVDMDRDQYVVKPYIRNFLSETPANRIRELYGLVNLGMLDQNQMATLIPNPDIKRLLRMKAAPTLEVERTISMLMKGKDVSPSDFTNIELAKPLVLLAFRDAQNRNAPQNVIGAFISYMQKMQQKEIELQPPQPPQGPPMAPPAQPGMEEMQQQPEQPINQ